MEWYLVKHTDNLHQSYGPGLLWFY